MNLNKTNWTKDDIKPYNEYLVSLGQDDKKKAWTKNLLKTNMDVLAIPASEIRRIAKEIAQGNYLSFLDLSIWTYYDNTAINGNLISKIKDFDTYKHYLDIYSVKSDNWATCDVLTFNVKNNEDKYYELAKQYAKSKYPFQRRIGINILFKLVEYPTYINKIFDLLNTFTNEEEYYVNMVNAWLICDCFIKQRDATIKFFDNNKLNKFTINKAIQKCCESYRVSKEDKDMLLKYKKRGK